LPRLQASNFNIQGVILVCFHFLTVPSPLFGFSTSKSGSLVRTPKRG
jgi:hypothetical protein